jgi:hypothetical protein
MSAELKNNPAFQRPCKNGSEFGQVGKARNILGTAVEKKFT